MKKWQNDLKNFEKDLPCLIENALNGKMYHYDYTGRTHSLSQDDIKVMNGLLKKYKEPEFNFIGVLDSIDRISTEYVRMISYMYVTDNYGLSFYDKRVYIPAYVINTTWDIIEFGDIIINEKNSFLTRIG